MIERDFHRLPELVRRWGCTMADLLHLGMQGAAQVCVNYTGAGPLSDRRYDWFEADDEPDEGKPWSAKTLAPNIAQLPTWMLREMDQPGAFPYSMDGVLVWGAWPEYRNDGEESEIVAWARLTFERPFHVTPDHLCMARAEVERVERDVLQRTPGDARQQPDPDADAATQYADDPRWPEELDIAFTAWRAACNGVERSGKRPSAFIRDWLAASYPNLSQEAVRRITTVANWDKKPGATRKE